MDGRLGRMWNRYRLRDREFEFLLEPPPDSSIICLDTETTGLDPHQAEIIAIGAVPIAGNRVLLSQATRWLVRPEKEIDPASIRIHGLRPRDLRDAMPIDAALRELLHFIASRPIMGYYLEFDLAMIDKYLRPMLGIGMPNPRIELSSRYFDRKVGLIPQGQVDLSFEAIRADLGVPRWDSHDALGDAVTTAMMYVCMEARSRDREL